MLTALELYQFRNWPAQTLQFEAQANVFIGDNGSGKTALIEAIYFLLCGRSFRTNVIERMITHDHQHFRLVGQLSDDKGSHVLGVDRDNQGQSKLKFDGARLSRKLDILQRFPVQLCAPDQPDLFHDGAKVRRQFLDWGVFYHFPVFVSAWQRYNKALRQRNAALKQQLPDNVVTSWDHFLNDLAQVIDEMRSAYVLLIQEALNDIMAEFTTAHKIDLWYYRGWPQEAPLKTILAEHLAQDRRQHYTSLGAQRADLRCKVGKRPVQEVLSRGQLKVLSYGLKLAQGQLLQQVGRHCLYLLDDFSSELDTHHQSLVIGKLNKLAVQSIITSIEPLDSQMLPVQAQHNIKCW